MTAGELSSRLISLVEELPDPSVDRIIYGSADAEIRSLAVAWMPYHSTIVKAHELGANVIVTHEPTFYGHWDLDEECRYDAAAEQKQRLLEELEMTVLRCHDVWDAMPGIGIPFAWAAFLGLDKPVRLHRHYGVYETAEWTAAEVARHIAARTADLGQAAVGFYGDPERVVRTVGVGTGCISDPLVMQEMGADLAVSVDDVVRAWIAGEWAEDSGFPLVVVNHAVSEEPGMRTLADYLRDVLPNVSVHHIRQGCSYRSIGNDGRK